MIKITSLIICSFLIIYQAQAQVQVTSFDRFGTELGSNPSGFKIFKDKLIFRAQNSSHGYELWISSGDPNSATLLKDINPGKQSGIVNYYFEASSVELNDELYFIASDNLSAGELWKTDGTETGTKKVSFNLDFNVTRLTLVQDKIYFTIYRNGFMEVWQSNGTAAGTKLIKKNIPALGLTTIQGEAGNLFFFSFRQTGSSKVEVWRSDGTADGTFMLINGIDGNGAGNTGTAELTQFISYHDELYFVSRNHIYRTDGSIINTVQVYQWNSGFNLVLYADVIVANDRMYFSFFKANRLFILASDGTEAGTSTVYDKTSSHYFAPSNLSPWNGDLIFTSAGAANRTSILKMKLADYSVSEVKQIDDQVSKPFIFSDGDFTRIMHNDTGLFFLMVPTDDYESVSWFSDLTEEGSYSVPQLDDVQYAIPFHNFFFLPFNVGGFNVELWRSGGTDSNTILSDNINPFRFGIGSSSLIGLNDQLIFNANDVTTGDELWTFKNDSLELLKDIRDSTMSSLPREFTKLHDKIIFSANDGIHGNELWVTEGTTVSTKMLADINEGSLSSSPGFFRFFRDQLFFVAEIADTNYMLSTDGIHVDTLFMLGLVANGFSYSPREWVAGDTLMYYITYETGEEVWVSNGTAAGTFSLKAFPTCNQLTVVNNRAYFTARGPDNYELELWTSDGTVEGTHLVRDLGIGYSSEPQDLIAYKDWLVFSAKTDLEGREMFRSNGNTATQTMDFNPGGQNTLYHAGFAVYNDLLFFNGRKSNTGSELYSSPADNPSPDLIKDIRPAAESSFPAELTPINGSLYFQAYTDENGMELWVTDGTEDGTKLAADMLPGELSSTPTNMTRAGKNLFFIAETEHNGRQIWMLKDEFMVSINEAEPKQEILIYPQPATDQVTIKSNEEIMDVEVYDLNGKWINRKKANSNTFSVADLPNGIYFIRFEIEGREVMNKLVKME
ncbi:MAG TPA: T9SS type A sorting domain-containing protein [Saprospiraceae bacterium]|nr:T9SS type A sorting domain-containing protein [Saprospiraceae bacterium]